MVELGNRWYCLTKGDIPKNIDCAEFMRVRFTMDSDRGRISVWIYGVLNTNTNIHLTWIVMKQNVMLTMYLINIQYKIINIDCMRGWHGKLSPRENQCRPRRSRGWQCPMLPSCAVNIYIISKKKKINLY